MKELEKKKLKDIAIGTIVQDIEHDNYEKFTVHSFNESNAYVKPLTGKSDYCFSAEFDDLCPFDLGDHFYISLKE